MSETTPKIAVLIATKDRWDLLISRALESVRKQSVVPTCVTIVNDGCSWSQGQADHITRMLRATECHLQSNTHTPGVAGAWNTGLQHLTESGFGGWVAILDDDDEWDDNHLEANASVALEEGANVAISGLRHLLDGQPIERAVIKSVAADEFLVGNPGWQGSNTFVSLELLLAVGGFREGLQSLNDRDLAYRVLSHPTTRTAFTGIWTATWHSQSEGTLSSRRAPQKLSGLRWFWFLYGCSMTEGQKRGFFERASTLFRFGEYEIINAAGDLPRHCQPHGDLYGL